MPKSSSSPRKNKKVPAKGSKTGKVSKTAGSSSASQSAARRLKPSKHKVLKKNKIEFVSKKPLPSAFKIFGRSLLVLKRSWKVFLVITIAYAILSLLLVHGISNSTSLNSLKSSLNSSSGGTGGNVSTSTALLVYIVGGGANPNNAPAAAGTYQTILLIVFSLAFIWSLRQLYNSAKIRARDSFYRGMYPLIQFMLVMIVVVIQLIPVLIGALFFSTVEANGIAASGLEQIIWGIVFIALACLSFYMVCSSIFAFYAVTLPDMTPMKALRSTRLLVRYRRIIIFRKIFFLVLALAVIGSIITLPFLLIATSLAGWIFFVLTIVALPVVHSYMYSLYREIML
jgi:hypothetical protein